MGLLKPIIVFFVGNFCINYFKENKRKINKVPLIGNDLKKLAEKNTDLMLLLIVTVISYII
tara:strand:+ start:81 stop:263 length:183 start_codon:yes stop_codon:yes gene_type:complete